MFVLSFMVGKYLVPTILKVPLLLYSDGNNFELAIAVAIGVFESTADKLLPELSAR
jgi:ACR3 family arsenite efflux pump ArsB